MRFPGFWNQHRFQGQRESWPLDSHAGTYETFDRGFQVVTNVAAFPRAGGSILLSPFDYDAHFLIEPQGGVRLASELRYRPLIYEILPGDRLIRHASQYEQSVRDGQQRMMMDELVAMLDISDRPRLFKMRQEAERKAEAIMLDHLTPQQRIDYRHRRRFYVPGRINKLYCILLGEGVAIVDRRTLQPVVALCLHPEMWLPDCDVALALKLLIDNDEQAFLEAAESSPLPTRPKPTPADEYAARLESELREDAHNADLR